MSSLRKPEGVLRQRSTIVTAALLALAVLLSGCAVTYTSTRGTGSFLLGLLYFFLLIIWLFLLIRIFADIFRRRDMSGWAKAGWVFLIIILPLLGILIYLIARPRDLPQDEEDARAAARVAGTQSVDDVAKAAELHDQGKLTDEEFEAIKRSTLS